MSGALMVVCKEFDGTLVPEDITPDTFSLQSASNQAASSFVSGSFVVSGVSTRVIVTGSNCLVSLNNTDWSTSVEVDPRSTVYYKVQASSVFGDTVVYSITAGTVIQSGTIGTVARDISPDTFTLSSDGSVAIGAYKYYNVTISGINDVTTVTATGCDVSLDNNTWYSSLNIANGQKLYYRVMSSSSYTGVVSYSITVGTATVTSTITTMANPDTSGVGLNWLGDYNNGSPGGVVMSGGILNNSGGSVLVPAADTSLAIPRDGNWYYWETVADGSGGYMGVAYQTAANQAAGLMKYYQHINISNSPVGKVAVRYNTSTGLYNIYIYAATGNTAGSTSNLGGAVVAVYPAVYADSHRTVVMRCKASAWTYATPVDIAVHALIAG